ncbi:MAG: hypothetical protein JRI23_36665 [Deltaproteobacteria bacterium]|jgi:hypothetical protein|nr:hypothetical protein [Deltaproteobacteria bacterium]MBW2537903.1 hypothetical protein [Deltaproteobacteria bacterium]
MRTKIIGMCIVLAAFINCRRDKPPVSPTPPAWLVTVVQDQATQHAPDAQLVGNMYQGVAHEEGDDTEWPLTLEPGQCYWFSGAGDQGIEELELFLYDPQDDRVAKATDGAPRAMMAHCPTVPGMYKLRAKAEEGRGHFHVGVYAKAAPEGTATPPAPTGTAAPAGQDLAALCDAEAKAAAPGAERVGDHFSGNADETDWYTALEVDKCYWFIGVGGEGVSELWLYLWDPADKRITTNKSESNKVTVGHCPEKPGMYHFQAKIGSGSGEYKVGVYAKKK